MKLLAILVAPVFMLAACASGEAVAATLDKCRYDRSAMLAMDENAFDQDLSNGGGGWRAIGNIPGCEIAAADLIAAYKRHHHLSTPILNWHEGQMLASAGQYQRAIPLLLAARKTEAGQEAWNAYVDATVAFLRKDKTGLIQARATLEKLPAPESWGPLKDGYAELQTGNGQTIKVRWPMNLDVVDGLIACFDRSYDEAYGGACRPKP